MKQRKLFWIRMSANPERGGMGNSFFALASVSLWNGKYNEIASPQTRAWISTQRGVEREHTDAPIWDIETIEQSTVPTDVQIALLTAAAESDGI